MASRSTALSQTLESITLTKIKELEKQRTSYEGRKHEILKEAENFNHHQRKKVFSLLNGVVNLLPWASLDRSVGNMTKWIRQSKYDPSLPRHMLEEFEKTLLTKLDIGSRRLELADLYSRLLLEWPHSLTTPLGHSKNAGSPLSEESFEVVEKDRLQQLVEKFEAAVFTPAQTDEVAIDNYLNGLFQEETILQDFLKDKVVLTEIGDVLNMRFKSIRSWSWDMEGKGMPVEPRKQLNGKYRIMMDEDVLQAIFLHYIGTMFSTTLHDVLTEVGDRFMRCGTAITQAELDKCELYLGSKDSLTQNVEYHRHRNYESDFFLAQLPSSVHEGAGGYDDEEYDDDDEDEDVEKKSGVEVTQSLLHLLATEVLVQRSIHGEVAVVQSDLQWFATCLPHSTIFAVLRFSGVLEDWISFFRKFLEAPLDLSPSSEGTYSRDRARIRQCGIPMAHALKKCMDELVLFDMDVAVRHEAGMYLYRLHDDLWLVGSPHQCRKAWNAMNQYVEVMGLEINQKTTGSVLLTQDESKNEETTSPLPEGKVCIGFLQLDPQSGKRVIDQEQVDAHIEQLRVQLGNCTTVLSWVQTWNSCIGHFFNHTFGEPAECLGPEHVDSILETHQRMQRILFEDSDSPSASVTEYLKRNLKERFSAEKVPDAFIFIPKQFGGLGLRNPFIPLLLGRSQMRETPDEQLQHFFRKEKEQHARCKREFEGLSNKERRKRHRAIYDLSHNATDSNHPTPTDGAPKIDDDNFALSWDEYTAHRERCSPWLAETYRDLTRRLVSWGVTLDDTICNELDRLGRQQPEIRLDNLDDPTRWIVHLYARELFEHCSGLTLVDKSSLPLRVLTMLKSRKVTWQMVL